MAEALHAGCPAGVSQTPDRCPPDTSDDDPWGDVEPCHQCGRERCDCDMDGRDSEHCHECLTWGAIQCRIHSDAEIAFARSYFEQEELASTLERLLALPGAWQGRAWEELRGAASRVLAEVRGDGH